jgi:uncharacterized protein YcbK (DUF882 family)
MHLCLSRASKPVWAPPKRRGHVAFAATVLALLAVTPDSAAETVHVVARGQTLDRIARRYHASVDAIREANELRPGQRIHPGLKLVIPEKGKEAEAARKAARLRADKAQPKPNEQAAPGKNAQGTHKKVAQSRGERGYARKPKRPGYIQITRGSEQIEIQLLTRRGKLVAPSLGPLTRILRHAPTNAKVPIDPRLATLLGTVSDHFGGRTIHVVSGFRPYSPAQYTRHSNHNIGKATDFWVEGVPNSALRDYCRTFRNAGVGYYPNSAFVHLDVRTSKVFWVDYSRPGEAPKYDSPAAQATADEAAGDVEASRDERPTPADGVSPDRSGHEDGSKNTSTAGVQIPDGSNGIHDAADPVPQKEGKQGQ